MKNWVIAIWTFKRKLKAFLKLTVWRFLLHVFGVWDEPFVFYPLSVVPAVLLVAYLSPTSNIQPEVPFSSLETLTTIWSPYPYLTPGVMPLASIPTSSLESPHAVWSSYLQPGDPISCLESLPPAWSPYLQFGVPTSSLETLPPAWNPYLQPRVPTSSPESLPPVWSPYLPPGVPTSSLEPLPPARSTYLQPGVPTSSLDSLPPAWSHCLWWRWGVGGSQENAWVLRAPSCSASSKGWELRLVTSPWTLKFEKKLQKWFLLTRE